MSDHIEEQEMEAEALSAIYDTAFEITSNEQPFRWSVALYPVDADDADERDELNHVGCLLKVELPLEYPDVLPIIDIEVIKGLANEHRDQLSQIAKDEAEASMGIPSIYTVCEAIRAWLVDNNVKGLDDVSMHAQMMRKQMEAEKKEANKLEFESQKVIEEMTEAEKEELEVRKRRAEGTPCTTENFEAWKKKFEEEMAEKGDEMDDKDGDRGVLKDKTNSKKKNKNAAAEDVMSSRLTGFEYFTQKGGIMNLDLLEKAAEEAAEASGDEDEEDEVDVDDLDVDEDLFDDDDDLDDLDFDDEDDYDDEVDYDDEDDDEIDI